MRQTAEAYAPDDSSRLSLPPRPTLELVAVREVSLRYIGPAFRSPAIRGPEEAVALARKVVRDDAKEHVVALYLDGRHVPIGHAVVSVGTATASLIHPREVFQPAIATGAVALVMLHNHPSGDTTPSPEDREVTRRLCDAGRLLGIPVLDHIVWSREGGFHSFRDGTPEVFASSYRTS